MPYNGAGRFDLYSPGNPVVTGTVISSTWANNTLSDIATGLSTAVTKNGQTTVTADIPMSGFKLTGLGAGSAAGDSLRFQQGIPTLYWYGAVGDGSTNDRAAIVAAQSAGNLLFSKGTYYVLTALTITGDITMLPGAKLKPASGVTITITGAISAGMYQIFDLSAGGHVDLTDSKTEAAPIEWIGVVGGDVAWSSPNATANEPLIDEALLYYPFEIQFKAPGLYSTTGHTMTVAHKFTGLGISTANAIYGDGKVFSDNAFMVSQGALLAGAKYVFQNGAGSDCPIFEDISIIGDPTDCIALGILPSSSTSLNWQSHAYKCLFMGYVGQHLGWANWNTWEACFFRGVLAPVAHTIWNDTSGSGNAGYVQKQNYVGCLLSQTQQVSGNIFLQNRDGDASPTSLALSNNSFTSCDFEGGFNGLYLMGSEQNFVACHLENMTGTYWVSGESTTYDSLWQNPSCNTGAGTLTGGINELVQDIGTRSSVFPITSVEVMSLTGCTTVPTSTVRWSIIPGAVKFVELNIQAVGGTSNATTKTLTTLPVWLRPSGDRIGTYLASDNGGVYTLGACIVKSTGVIELYTSINFAAWTAAGATTIQNFNLTYSIA